jgi:hypothetical protein
MPGKEFGVQTSTENLDLILKYMTKGVRIGTMQKLTFFFL